VYGICVGNPLGNDLAECFVYRPSLAIPEECVNVEDVAELLNRRDAPYITQMLQSNHFSNAVGSYNNNNKLYLHDYIEIW